MLMCYLIYVSGTSSVVPDTCYTAVITYHKNRFNMCWRTSKQSSARAGFELHIFLASAARKSAQQVALREVRGSNLCWDIDRPNRSLVHFLSHPEKILESPCKLNDGLYRPRELHFTVHYEPITQRYGVDLHTTIFFSTALAAQSWAMASSFLRFFRDHTQRHTTVGRTPLNEWSARRTDLYLTTHNTHNRQTNIRTHNLSRRAAADLRLRPRGYWGRQTTILPYLFVRVLFNDAVSC